MPTTTTYDLSACDCCGGGGGDPVPTGCCPSYDIPAMLYATLDLDYFAMGGSPDYTLNFTLLWDAGLSSLGTDPEINVWSGTTTCNGEDITLRIHCKYGTSWNHWQWSVLCSLGYSIFETNLPVSSCNPFTAGGTNGGLLSFCCGRDDRPFSLTAVLAITE
jgi:hypothetical protein